MCTIHQMHPTHERCLQRLAGFLSGAEPLDRAAELLTDPVRLHWGGHDATLSLPAWVRAIGYMRHRVPDLGVTLDRIEAQPDGTLIAHGRWTGTIGGEHRVSEPCAPRYRVTEGRIAEIWTHPDNYTFPLGPHISTTWGGLLTWVRMRAWGALQ